MKPTILILFLLTTAAHADDFYDSWDRDSGYARSHREPEYGSSYLPPSPLQQIQQPVVTVPLPPKGISYYGPHGMHNDQTNCVRSAYSMVCVDN